MAHSSDDIQVTIRTARTGHETVVLPLDQLPAFIDRHLAEGRLVVAESGDESFVLRIGREIIDFFLGRRKASAAKPKEEITVLNRLGGGSDSDEGQVELVGEVLSAAATARQGGNAFRDVPIAAPGLLPLVQGPRNPRLDAAAEMRAWRGLVDKEGEATVAPLLHGGAIGVRSTLWPEVLYLVSTGGIAVLHQGRVQTRLCLQILDGAPVWDAVASRLSLLRAGVEGEVEVWATANAVVC